MLCFHNICIINDDVLEQYITENQEDDQHHNNEGEFFGLNGEDDENGVQKRNHIPDDFF